MGLRQRYGITRGILKANRDSEGNVKIATFKRRQRNENQFQIWNGTNPKAYNLSAGAELCSSSPDPTCWIKDPKASILKWVPLNEDKRRKRQKRKEENAMNLKD